MVRTTDTVKVQLPSDSIFARYLRQQGYVITPHNQLTLLTSERKVSLKVRFTKSGMPVIRYIWNILISGVNSIAKELFTLLAEKAKEGEKVRACLMLSEISPVPVRYVKII